ncbi:MAG: hypothetical protein DI539_01260 [Flavobacterium psychrophilum]|nr:MAG: hypothetical protein DI539_01260 [Flavobacterium psychrophilum]
MVRILSVIFVLLFSVNQRSSEGKFKIQELGFSFDKPGWYGVQNKDFIPVLKKYNWNVESAVQGVAVGSIEIIRYHKTRADNDKKVFLTVTVSGLHKKLRDFNEFLAFQKNIKVNAPDLKILQPLTQVNISGKKATVNSMSYREKDGKGNSCIIIDQSVKIFMGNFVYNIYIHAKDAKDIVVFDNLVKTIAITK